MRFGAGKSLVFGFKLFENDAEPKTRSIKCYVNNSGSVAGPKSLELELREFTKLCVRSQVEVTAESYELASDVDFAGVTCMQAVLAIGSERLWIVRAYARNGGDEMLLIHWNGPRQLALCFPIPLFTSVVPLFAIETGV